MYSYPSYDSSLRVVRHSCASLHYVAHQKNTRDKKFAFPRGSSSAWEFCGAAALLRCFLWNWMASSSFPPSTMPQPSFDPIAPLRALTRRRTQLRSIEAKWAMFVELCRVKSPDHITTTGFTSSWRVTSITGNVQVASEWSPGEYIYAKIYDSGEREFKLAVIITNFRTWFCPP